MPVSCWTTCSAGVSSLKFVAKIASGFRKPDGLTVVPPDRVLDFVHPLLTDDPRPPEAEP